MSFPLVEYRVWPSWKDSQIVEWHGCMTVDLRHVMGAHQNGSGSTCCIALEGNSRWDEIDVPYEDFVRDWKRAKGL